MAINFFQVSRFVFHFFISRRKGHGAHSPFLYQLCEEVFYNDSEFYAFSRLARLRKELLSNTDTILVDDLGAGSKTFKDRSRIISDIAEKGISSKRQNETLYRLINRLGCKTSVELGTSLGLNALYMASVDHGNQVISVEGSRALYSFAKDLAQKNGFKNVKIINGNFDEILPDLLKDIPGLDLLYIDGNHRYEPTLRYFELALTRKHNNSVFVFDDIYWSSEMQRAWKKISQHPEVTMCVDTFYSGYVFFRKEIREKVYSRIYLPL